VVTIHRPGITGRPVHEADLNLPQSRGQRLLADVVTGRLSDVSSSEIRARIAKRLPIGYLVPNSVERYIRDHALYGWTNEEAGH